MDDPISGYVVNILLVEDNPADARLTFEAFQEYKIRNHVYVVNDGVKAMAFLRRQDAYAAMPRPDLIMLDLNLPRKDGREVLAELKSDENLKQIPVVVMSTSQAEEDIFQSYDLHANCFITKPIDLERFFHVVKSIEHFWLTIVSLPPASTQ